MHRAFKALDVTAAFEPGGSLSPPPGIMTATGSALRVSPSTICRLIARAFDSNEPWIEHISDSPDAADEAQTLAVVPLIHEQQVCSVFLIHLPLQTSQSKSEELSSQVRLWSAYSASVLQRHILQANLQTLQHANRWIAHELRSPLTGLIGFSTMLETDLYMGQSISQDDTKELIELVRTQGKQLQNTTNALSEMRLHPIEQERLISVPITECLAAIGRSWSEGLVSRSLAPLTPTQHAAEVTLDLPRVVSALERVLEALVEGIGTPATAPIQMTAHMTQADYWPQKSRYVCIAVTLLAGTDVEVSERAMHVLQLATDQLRYLLLAHRGHLHLTTSAPARELQIYLPIS